VGQLLSVISAASTCLPGIAVPLASTKPISERLCTAVQQTVDGWIALDLRHENMVTPNAQAHCVANNCLFVDVSGGVTCLFTT